MVSFMNDNRIIDLHTHTTMSDGSLTPYELVKLAKDMKVSAISITDHNSLNGVEDAIFLARDLGIEVIPGIEISAEYKPEVHILAYFFNSGFLNIQSWLIDKREEYTRIAPKLIIAKLNGLGFSISWKFVKAIAGSSGVYLYDIAKALVKKRYYSDVNCVMHELLNMGRPAYVPLRPLIEEVIGVVREVGGIPVLAHPFKYGMDYSELEEFVKDLKGKGILGIEVFHSEASLDDIEFLCMLATKYKLKVTGGSDYHGVFKPNIELGIGLGGLSVPYILLEELRGI